MTSPRNQTLQGRYWHNEIRFKAAFRSVLDAICRTDCLFLMLGGVLLAVWFATVSCHLPARHDVLKLGVPEKKALLKGSC